MTREQKKGTNPANQLPKAPTCEVKSHLQRLKNANIKEAHSETQDKFDLLSLTFVRLSFLLV